MRPVRSMTGYGTAETTRRDGVSATVTLKSVNHRFLDVQLRLPAGCEVLEAELRRAVKEHAERGHVELTLDLGRSAAGGYRIDERALEELVGGLRAAAARLGLESRPEIGALLRVPGVLVTEARGQRVEETELREVLDLLLPRAFAALNAARETEGAELMKELQATMHRLQVASDLVVELRLGVRQALFDRLRLRLEELLAGGNVSEERLLTEAALMAEKSDVEEEMVRLRAHLGSFLEILEVGGAVGKRLDFLLQELAREANTTLAKTGSAAGPDGLRLTELGLEMKADIERAREQVQNLE